MNRQRNVNRQSRKPPRPNQPSRSERQTTDHSPHQPGRRRHEPHPSHTPGHPVPTAAQVRPGEYVSIVLKEDQPTGRQVQGIVRDVLTLGEHPRGIKVRLNDGRVGRVQRVSSADEIDDAQSAQPAAYTSTQGENADRQGKRSGRRRFGREEDGADCYDERRDQAMSLEAYFPSEWRDNQAGEQHQAQPQFEGPIDEPRESVCPICYEFRGDEAAVTHHVNSHFSS